MSSPKPPFFPIFLLTAMLLTETLSLSALWHTALLPPMLLVWGTGVLLLITLLTARGFFPVLRRLRPLKQTLACVAALAVIIGCSAASYGALLLHSSLDALFHSVTAPNTAPWQPLEDPFVLYLGGSDTRSGKLVKSRCDVNILAVINPNTMQILLVNTPRDTYLPNPAGNGTKDKLTHCGLYGMDNTKQALAALYGHGVDYGAVINFKGFETLIDALGGITVESDRAFKTTIGGYPIAQGENRLNGTEALAFARERYKLAGGDGARGQNQMQVLRAMLGELSAGKLLQSWQQVLQSLEGMLTTDLPLTTMAQLAADHLPRLSEWALFSVSLTGSDSTAATYSSSVRAYVMLPDADAVQRISALMGRVLANERLSEADFG